MTAIFVEAESPAVEKQAEGKEDHIACPEGDEIVDRQSQGKEDEQEYGG